MKSSLRPDTHSAPTSLPIAIAKPWRIGLSLLLIAHGLAVFAEPFRFFTQSPVKPAAEDAGWLRGTLAPYVDFLYLSHGYSFFAPNPGPSHLLDCAIRPQNAVQLPTQRVFPDRKLDQPRLLYHRYFMFSEFYNSLFAPISLTREDQADAELRARWTVDRQLYETLQDAVRNRLMLSYPNHEFQLRRIEHQLPLPQQVLVEKWSLTDGRLYTELSEGEIEP